MLHFLFYETNNLDVVVDVDVVVDSDVVNNNDNVVDDVVVGWLVL